MTAPHLRFRHLDADVLTATAALLEARTSELPPAEALTEYRQWADAASGAYGLPRVTVLVGPAAGTPGYSSGILRLARASVVALLAGYRRHMQHHGITLASVTPDEDAYAWVLSLYHTVRPRQLARLAAAGRIPHLTASGIRGLGTVDPAGASPIDDGMRRAIFAALRDRYGVLSRPDRLDKLTLLAGRPVCIGSTNELTRAEAGRVLDRLRNGSAGPAAGRLLRDARAFIRQAALAGRITPAARDRYLAMLDGEQRQAADGGTAGLRAAIRNRAIRLYEADEICHNGLNDFLAAAGLDPHNR